MHMVLVEGGSTAYGCYDQDKGGWANRLKIACMPYNTLHPVEPILVDGRASPGRTIKAVNRRLDERALQSISQRNTLSTVLSVGINESKVLRDFRTWPAIRGKVSRAPQRLSQAFRGA